MWSTMTLREVLTKGWTRKFRGMSRLFTPETLDLYSPLILVNIARQSKGRILTKYLNVSECRPTL